MSFPQPLSEILPKVIAKLGLSQKVKEIEIVKDWADIVGKAVANHCKPVTLDRGCLTVNVDSSPWLNELERYSKKKILEKVQERLGVKSVRRIRFRIGSIKQEVL